MNKKYLGIGVLILIVLALGLMFPRPSESILKKLVDEAIQEFGASPGPESTSPYNIFNGVEHRYFSQNFSNASTTLCSFRTPAATSTLIFGSAQITTGTSTATVWEFGKSTLMDATTTILGYAELASLVKATLLASSTQGSLATKDNSDPVFVFAPNNYFNVKFGGGSGLLTANSLKGTCKAEFIVN